MELMIEIAAKKTTASAMVKVVSFFMLAFCNVEM